MKAPLCCGGMFSWRIDGVSNNILHDSTCSACWNPPGIHLSRTTPDPSSVSQRCRTNSNGKLNFSDCLVIHGLDHVYRNADFSFGFGYSRVRIGALSGCFRGHCLNEVFQTVHGYDRCCTPRCYTGHSGARNVKMSFLAMNFFAGEVQTS